MVKIMAEKKMTFKEFYNGVLAVDEVNEELKEFARVQLEKANNRNSKNSEKRAEENKAVAIAIKSVLNDNPMTASEISHALNGDYTTQKIVPIVKRLVANGEVSAVEVKVNGRKANGYTLATTEEVAE